MKASVAVLLSGRGSNFVALADAIERGDIAGRIDLVISNRPDASGLELARSRGIQALAFDHTAAADRRQHDESMLSALAGAGVEWVCLAGYMRILSPEFIRAFPQRILNIHPSLLPSFPGLGAQRQALEHGVKVSGCTVHFVDEGLDSGPIVAQRAVAVESGDTAKSLGRRILRQEHQLYPSALARLLGEPWSIAQRRVLFGATTE